MKNMEIDIDEDQIMTIRVDLKKTFGRSKSGKTITISSSEGNHPVVVGRDEIIGLNVYKKG
jgi:hypothetical protein